MIYFYYTVRKYPFVNWQNDQKTACIFVAGETGASVRGIGQAAIPKTNRFFDKCRK